MYTSGSSQPPASMVCFVCGWWDPWMDPWYFRPMFPEWPPAPFAGLGPDIGMWIWSTRHGGWIMICSWRCYRIWMRKEARRRRSAGGGWAPGGIFESLFSFSLPSNPKPPTNPSAANNIDESTPKPPANPFDLSDPNFGLPYHQAQTFQIPLDIAQIKWSPSLARRSHKCQIHFDYNRRKRTHRFCIFLDLTWVTWWLPNQTEWCYEAFDISTSHLIQTDEKFCVGEGNLESTSLSFENWPPPKQDKVTPCLVGVPLA